MINPMNQPAITRATRPVLLFAVLTALALLASLAPISTPQALGNPSLTPLSDEPRPLTYVDIANGRAFFPIEVAPETCRVVFSEVGTRQCLERTSVYYCPAGLSFDAQTRMNPPTYNELITGDFPYPLAAISTHCVFGEFKTAYPTTPATPTLPGGGVAVNVPSFTG